MKKTLSKQALQRMPLYLQYLTTLRQEGKTEISAPFLAEHFGFTEIQVRKDLSAVSTVQGKPKVGFRLIPLIEDIEETLGCGTDNTAVVAGAGSMGSALLSFKGFKEYGVKVTAAFDIKRSLIGTDISGIPVYDVRDLKTYCKNSNVRIGIITVPVDCAQSICDSMVKAGIKAIWNFAQVHLTAPKDVLVYNENMAASLAVLIQHINTPTSLV